MGGSGAPKGPRPFGFRIVLFVVGWAAIILLIAAIQFALSAPRAY